MHGGLRTHRGNEIVNGFETEFADQTDDQQIAVWRRFAFDTKLSWRHELWRVAQKATSKY